MATQLSPWRVWDALYIQHHRPGFSCLGREDVLQHIVRTLHRTDVQHIVVVGKRGSGKTMLIQGLAQTFLARRFSGMRSLPLLHFDTQYLLKKLTRTPQPEAIITYFEEALASLPSAVLIFDDMSSLFSAFSETTTMQRVVAAITSSLAYRSILFFSAENWSAIESHYETLARSCEVIHLDELSDTVCASIVEDRARSLAGQHQVQLEAAVPQAVFDFSKKMSGVAQPQRALHLLEEVCAAVAVAGRSVVTRNDVAQLFSQHIGQESAVFDEVSAQRIHRFREVIAHSVIGQEGATSTVSSTIERAWLGLKNPQRPLGSFLFLGPSGVGKTELARVIAREVYGGERAFVRIDMSEYAQPHSVQRLIGAPPGYVGHEAGGQLTNAVARQPFSLILLDEIEKADPSVFDIFLQILEDGRLTDGHGATIDFRQTVLIATSNIGVDTIIAGWLRDEPVTEVAWRQRFLTPLLTAHFRLEFLNRFESISVFTPLSHEALASIAQLELQKIAERLTHHNVDIQIDSMVLEEKIRAFSDPRFGARPLKRWLEGAVEEQLVKELLPH